MKTEEEKLEDLLTSKSFENLTGEEKEFVLDLLGSEDQFKALQKVHASLQDRAFTDSVEPDPNVLILLKRRLRETKREPFLIPAILHYKIPAYAAAILVVMVGFAVGIISRPAAQVPRRQIDTVYLTKTDTIYRERLLIKYVRVPTPVEPLMVTASTKSDKALSVSMKEKEELDKLLVSELN